MNSAEPVLNSLSSLGLTGHDRLVIRYPTTISSVLEIDLHIHQKSLLVEWQPPHLSSPQAPEAPVQKLPGPAAPSPLISSEQGAPPQPWEAPSQQP